MSLSAYDQLLLNLAERCNISETKVLRKSKELINLLNSKRSINCSETCKVLVCLELAAVVTSVSFSRDIAVRLSGCTKRNYVNNFNNISKLLNLNKTYTIKEICLLVGVPAASDKSQNLFDKYGSVVTDLSALEHPMYLCAAVLAVCDEENYPVNLSKLVDISKIKKTELKKLSKKFVLLLKKKSSELPKKKGDKKNNQFKNHFVLKRDDYCISRREEMSDEKFEDWKRKMLEED